MVSLIKYGALSGGEKYNTNILEIDGLSTDTKPITTFIEYGVDGREIGRTNIENGSTFTEIDTGKLFMYDAENVAWYEIVTNNSQSATTLTTHTGNADIHVTAEDKTAWNHGIDGTPVGCIFPFAGINLPAGYLLCNGTSYKKTDYPDLYAAIGNTYGGDTENFKVPNLVDKFIQGSTTSGTTKEAGLPNITGETKYISEGCIWSGEASGAFNKYSANTSIQINNVAVSGKHYGYYFSFDASRCSTIYGNSTTVQPPALTMVYIIKAYPYSHT